MSILGNILWILLGGGIILALEYVIGGLVLCATIVGIPFGVQCFKLAYLSLVPFGKEVIPNKYEGGCLALAFNIVWVLLFGLLIAITHMLFALLSAITIIGLPFAVQHLKLAYLAFVPFGKEIRERAQQ